MEINKELCFFFFFYKTCLYDVTQLNKEFQHTFIPLTCIIFIAFAFSLATMSLTYFGCETKKTATWGLQRILVQSL